jgi:hypothetical protein
MNTVARALAALLLLSAGAESHGAPSAAELAAMSARFAPVEIKVVLDGLPLPERQALAKIIAAAEIIDGVYLSQAAPGNTALLLELAGDHSPQGAARLDYFLVNKGPWSELDHEQPFVPGVGARPDQAGFYPADASRIEVESWFKGLAEPARAAAIGFFTTIRRDEKGGLIAVPYSREYQGELLSAARLLEEGAALTRQPTLQAFLKTRAAAFLSNDYYASDVAWMDLDSSIEPTIGPYEVYQDRWFNYKAAFEAVIGIVDAGETEKLQRFSQELQGLEDRLPIEPRYRRAHLGGYAPIRLINAVYTSGDSGHGVTTAAFNLPNDERVVAAKGSKRVLLKNYQQAKFEQVLVPISKRVLAPHDQPLVRFEGFFTHILMHELMHGLGPQTITVNGAATTVREQLKELNGPLEEAKADVSGLWALQQLVDKGVLAKSDEQAYYVTFLASAFRTLRFGGGEAHSQGMLLQLNYLLDAGAFKAGADGRYSVDFAKVRAGVTGLTHDIMTIQATGDYAKAKELLGRLGVLRPEVQRLLETLAGVPVDIRPKFVTALALTHG